MRSGACSAMGFFLQKCETLQYFFANSRLKERLRDPPVEADQSIRYGFCFIKAEVQPQSTIGMFHANFMAKEKTA
jgi:hypothetical protein